jgi:hypothetical protein
MAHLLWVLPPGFEGYFRLEFVDHLHFEEQPKTSKSLQAHATEQEAETSRGSWGR